MDDSDELQQKLNDIGTRYLQRTLGELVKLRELLAAVRGGAAGAKDQIQQMAHKIRGSGSMFGFDAVSERARELELLAHDASTVTSGNDFVQQLESRMSALEEQVRSAARQRGIQ